MMPVPVGMNVRGEALERRAVGEIAGLACKAFAEGDVDAAMKVEPLEQVVDRMQNVPRGIRGIFCGQTGGNPGIFRLSSCNPPGEQV